MNNLIKSLKHQKLFKQSFLYTIAGMMEKALPFFLLPVLTRFLSTEDYGLVSLFTVFIGFVMPIIAIGTRQAILRNFFKDGIDIKRFVSSAFTLVAISSIIIAIIISIFKNSISELTGLPSESLKLIPLIATLQVFVSILLVTYQAKSKVFQYSLFNILTALFTLLISIVLVVYLDYGWKGRINGQLYAVAILGLISVFILYKEDYLTVKPLVKYLKYMIRFGAPMIMHGLGGKLIAMSDRVIISILLGVSATGVYTAGYQIGMIVDVVAHSLSVAWAPWVYKKLNNSSLISNKTVVKYTYFIALGFIVCSLIFGYVGPFMMKVVVGKEFQGGASIIIWIALGYAFKGIYYLLVSLFTFTEKTGKLALITLSTAIVNILLNFYLINRMGLMGAAVATTISYIYQATVTWIIARRLIEMPWNLK